MIHPQLAPRNHAVCPRACARRTSPFPAVNPSQSCSCGEKHLRHRCHKFLTGKEFSGRMRLRPSPGAEARWVLIPRPDAEDSAPLFSRRLVCLPGEEGPGAEGVLSFSPLPRLCGGGGVGVRGRLDFLPSLSEAG